jgi:hypothetical protein
MNEKKCFEHLKHLKNWSNLIKFIKKKHKDKEKVNLKITSDLTNLTTAILILTVQMFFEWTLSDYF